MSFRSQKTPKAKANSKVCTREKTKAKDNANNQTSKRGTPQAAPKEVAERAISGLTSLGAKFLRFPPLAKYFDDCL